MDTQKRILTKIAWDYYINNYTQQEIADRLRISRLKVTRYLQKARDLGIVKITVMLDQDFSFEKEDQLKNLLNLARVTVVPSAATEEDTDNSIGIAGAMRLNQMLTADDVLGVAWGRSLYAVGKNLSPVRSKGTERVQVVQLMGGLTISDKINPEEIVKMIARRLDAQGFLMNIPAVVTSREARNILMNDPSVSPIFAKALECTVCLLGLGNLSETSSLFSSGAYTRDDLAELKASGAVGDILSRPFDQKGQVINNQITDRIMAVPLDQILKIDKRIAVASGQDKVRSIIAASRGGFINELVTDEDTADGIIGLLT